MSNYGLELLSTDQCHELLRTQTGGRVGVCSGRPGVFPVLYALLDDEVVFDCDLSAQRVPIGTAKIST